jgi:hypothetical protein
MNKDKVKGELPSFLMLVVKCSMALPLLSIVLGMKKE